MKGRWREVVWIFLAVGLVLAGLALEYRAVDSLLSGDPVETALLPHLFATLLLAVGYVCLLPSRYRSPALLVLLLLFALLLLLPGVAIFGLLLALLLPARHARLEAESRSEQIDIPNVAERRLRVAKRGIIEGSALGVLERSTEAKKRFQAVMATRNMEDRDAISIIRVALRDPVDEVRLLAYSLIDRKEKKINSAINQELKQLQHAERGERAALSARIAFQYWELAYLGLSQGAVLSHILNTAQHYAESALDGGYADQAALHLLLSRIALRMDEYVDAYQHLEEARVGGMPQDKLLPYMAELAFATRRFDHVAEYLANLEGEICRMGVLTEIQEHWERLAGDELQLQLSGRSG